MESRRVGRSGLAVSSIGLGTNNLGIKLDMDQSREVVHAALDSGITFFDTADSYGASEERLGELLEGVRADVVIATKFGMDVRRFGGDNGLDWGARGSRRYVIRAVESSLRRLRTDWIDLYQFHQPDPLTPIEETLSALDDLVRAGKVRYLGHSNFPAWRIADAHGAERRAGGAAFVSAQNGYSLLDRSIEAEILPAIEHYGLGLIPHSPIAGGLLTGKYRRGEEPPAGSRVEVLGQRARLTDTAFDRIEALEAFAVSRGLELLDVAIGWLVGRPSVASVILGATSAAQLATNLRAAAWSPTAADLAELDAITA